jgi:hypothetical protein
MQRQRKTEHFMTRAETKRDLRNLSVIWGLALMLGLLSWARAAQPVPPPAPATPPAPELQFVKSVFVNSPAFGKDPFFPRSTRRGAVVSTNSSIETLPSLTFLALKGISGPKTHRLAIINNRTFEVGEEAELKTGTQTVRVKCVEIRDDCVVVSINGLKQNLYLGPKL